MLTLHYHAEWAGERAAGIHPGSEDLSIVFKYSGSPDVEMIDYFRDAVAEYFDGAHVKFINWEVSK